MNIQNLTTFTTILLLALTPLQAKDEKPSRTDDLRNLARGLVGDYISQDDIDQFSDATDKFGKSAKELYQEFLKEVLDLEIKKEADPVDAPDDAVVDVIDDAPPEGEEGRIVEANLYDKAQLNTLLEQEFIIGHTQKLTVHFPSKSKSQKNELIKNIQKFFSKTYIFKSTRIYSTPKGITISGQWDSAVYLVKAYQGQYPMDKLSTMEKKALDIIKKELPAIIKGKKNDYEKAIAIHDWLVVKVGYHKRGDHQSGAQAIAEGYAVCAGYARAYSIMLGAAGIPSTVVLGNKHAWNFLRADGKWMHVDVTWDDGHSRSDVDIAYTFFGLNHEEMTLVHSQLRLVWRYLPVCTDPYTSYAYNHFIHIKGLDDLCEVLISTEPNQCEAVRIYSKTPMTKLAFTQAVAKAKKKGCQHGTIDSWSFEKIMSKSGIVYYTLGDDDDAAKKAAEERQKMEFFFGF